jgi:DUF4097 and DUF4098 domain-containing protein YvlB
MKGRRKMASQTITVGEHPVIHVKASGNLVIQAGDDRQVSALYNGKTTRMANLDGSAINVFCEEDEVLLVPKDALLQIDTVAGDLSVRELKGDVLVGNVGGDFNLQYASKLAAESVGGDMRVTEVTGALDVQAVGGDLVVNRLGSNLTVQQVGADVRVYQVDGAVDIQKAGGDVRLSLIGGNVVVFSHGDIHTGLSKTTGQTVQLTASGDVRLALPEGASAALDLNSRHDNIKVRLGERLEVVKEEHFDLELGQGETKVKVEADGDVVVSDSKADLHHEYHDFDVFDHHIEEQVERLNRQIERAARLAQTRAEEAAERSARRAEDKIRQATEKMQRRAMSHGFPFEAPSVAPATEPAPAPAPAKEPKATDEERMLILKMLQEKKITVEEADKLFEALEPKSK